MNRKVHASTKLIGASACVAAMVVAWWSFSNFNDVATSTTYRKTSNRPSAASAMPIDPASPVAAVASSPFKSDADSRSADPVVESRPAVPHGSLDPVLLDNQIVEVAKLIGINRSEIERLLDSPSKCALFSEVVTPHIERIWAAEGAVLSAVGPIGDRMIAEGRFESYDGDQSRLRSMAGEEVYTEFQNDPQKGKIVRWGYPVRTGTP